MKRTIALGVIAGILGIGMAACAATEPTSPSTGNAAKKTTDKPAKKLAKIIDGNEAIMRIDGNADDHKGDKVKDITGQVFNIDRSGGDNGLALQVWLDDNMNQAIVYIADPDFKVKEDDNLRVEAGEITGTFEGQNAMGADMQATTIRADDYKLLSYEDMHPATSKSSAKRFSIAGVEYTVHAEFAADQTRVYVKAVNNNGDDADVDSSPKVVSNGKQMESDMDFDADFPSLSYDLSPGASTEGVLLYPAMDKGSVTMHFTGHDADYNDIKQTIDL